MMKAHLSTPLNQPMRCLGVRLQTMYLVKWEMHARQKRAKTTLLRKVPLHPPSSQSPLPPPSADVLFGGGDTSADDAFAPPSDPAPQIEATTTADVLFGAKAKHVGSLWRAPSIFNANDGRHRGGYICKAAPRGATPPPEVAGHLFDGVDDGKNDFFKTSTQRPPPTEHSLSNVLRGPRRLLRLHYPQDCLDLGRVVSVPRSTDAPIERVAAPAALFSESATPDSPAGDVFGNINYATGGGSETFAQPSSHESTFQPQDPSMQYQQDHRSQSATYHQQSYVPPGGGGGDVIVNPFLRQNRRPRSPLLIQTTWCPLKRLRRMRTLRLLYSIPTRLQKLQSSIKVRTITTLVAPRVVVSTLGLEDVLLTSQHGMVDVYKLRDVAGVRASASLGSLFTFPGPLFTLRLRRVLCSQLRVSKGRRWI